MYRHTEFTLSTVVTPRRLPHSGGKIDVQFFIAKSGRGVDGRQLFLGVGHPSCLFFELTLCTHQRVFAGREFACRQFEKTRFKGVAKLLYEHHAPIVEKRHRHGTPGVMSNLPDALVPRGILHLIDDEVNNLSLVHNVSFEALYIHHVLAFIWTTRCGKGIS